MNAINPPLALVTMSEVAERISLKDSEAAKRWCLSNDITVHKLSKKDFVYEFDLEYHTSKPFVFDIQRRHPNDWKEILRDVLNWDALYNYFLLNLGEPRNDGALAEIAPSDKEQEELLKRLLR